MRKVILIVIFIAFGVWMVSADQSDWMFCLLKKNEVIISLKQTTWYYKCNDTIISLEHLIIQTAKDLMKVQTYINRRRDIEYRKTIKAKKIELLNKLQLSRTNILANMKTFESHLLIKSIQYFIIKITPYKISLQRSLVKIDALNWFRTPAIDSYALLLTAQIATIEALGKVTDKQELVRVLAKYVYLKKEIAWKSE